MDDKPMKQCTKCGKEKPDTNEYFAYENKQKGLRHAACKKCVAQYARDKRSADPEAARKKDHERYTRDREHIRSLRKAALAKNPEPNRQRVKRWAEENPLRVREHRRRYGNKHRDNERIRLREYNRHNPKVKIYTQQRVARKQGLPSDFSLEDWERALTYFEHRCAVCGRPIGLWHTLAMDHWIPLSVQDCPGTVAKNIIPLCHGIGGCNNGKANKLPFDWLVERFGKRKAKTILKRIQAYFDTL